jgi:hypothetical protein
MVVLARLEVTAMNFKKRKNIVWGAIIFIALLEMISGAIYVSGNEWYLQNPVSKNAMSLVDSLSGIIIGSLVALALVKKIVGLDKRVLNAYLYAKEFVLAIFAALSIVIALGGFSQLARQASRLSGLSPDLAAIVILAVGLLVTIKINDWVKNDPNETNTSDP